MDDPLTLLDLSLGTLVALFVFTAAAWLVEHLFVEGVKGLWNRAFGPPPDEASAEALAALDRARRSFYREHGSTYGEPGDAFVYRAENERKLLRSTHPGTRRLRASDLDGEGFHEAPPAPPQVVEAFLSSFQDELRASPSRPLATDLALQRIETDVTGVDVRVEQGFAAAGDRFSQLQAQSAAILDAQGVRGREIADELRADLKRAADAYNGLDIHGALVALDGVAGRLDGYREFNPAVEGDLLGVRQLALAMKAEALHTAGRSQDRDAVVTVLKGSGPIVAEAVGGVALVAADMEDAEWLDELLPRLPAGDRRRPFLAAALGWIRRDVEETLVATAGLDEPDLLAMRVQALCFAPTPDRAVEAAGVLDRLDGPWPDVTPLKDLMVANLTFTLLRRVVEERLETPGLDRVRLVRQVRTRYDRAIGALEGRAGAHPAGLLEALGGKAMFLEYVEEQRAADIVSARISALRAAHPPEADVALFRLDEAATPEAIRQLQQAGESPARLLVPQALAALQAGKTDEAEARLRLAWAEASTPYHAERALAHVVGFLLANRGTEAARTFLDGAVAVGGAHPHVRPDEAAVQRIRVTYDESGWVAAIAELDLAFVEYPRSLSLLRQRYTLLTLRLKEVRGPQAQTPGGAEYTAAIAALREGAAALYDVLPAPYYKVVQAHTQGDLGDEGRAHELMREAFEEGVEGFQPDGRPLPLIPAAA